MNEIDTVINDLLNQSTRQALFMLIRWFNNKFEEGKFELCDQLLASIKPALFDEDRLVALLSFTFAARKFLPYRDIFIEDCRKRFYTMMSKQEADQLLKKLK